MYHGRTGVVWNVTKRAVGVEVNKQARTLQAIEIFYDKHIEQGLQSFKQPVRVLF